MYHVFSGIYVGDNVVFQSTDQPYGKFLWPPWLTMGTVVILLAMFSRLVFGKERNLKKEAVEGM